MSNRINRDEATKARRAWGAALNDLHSKQMAVAEAERQAAADLAALSEARKAVDALLSKWSAAEARAEAARQSLSR